MNGVAWARKARVEMDGAVYDAVFDEIKPGAQIALAELISLIFRVLPSRYSVAAERTAANQDNVEISGHVLVCPAVDESRAQ